jgi:hypothetical protein
MPLAATLAQQLLPTPSESATAAKGWPNSKRAELMTDLIVIKTIPANCLVFQ